MFTAWRKSSFSGGSSQSACVEVGLAPGRVGVRDTEARDAGHIDVSRAAWRSFTRLVTDVAG